AADMASGADRTAPNRRDSVLIGKSLAAALQHELAECRREPQSKRLMSVCASSHTISPGAEGLSMTKLGRATPICCLFIAVLGFAATSRAQTRPVIAKQIADTYGLESFEQIEAIRYTFHLEAPGHKLSRSWVWRPKTDQV